MGHRIIPTKAPCHPRVGVPTPVGSSNFDRSGFYLVHIPEMGKDLTFIGTDIEAASTPGMVHVCYNGKMYEGNNTRLITCEFFVPDNEAQYCTAIDENGQAEPGCNDANTHPQPIKYNKARKETQPKYPVQPTSLSNPPEKSPYTGSYTASTTYIPTQPAAYKYLQRRQETTYEVIDNTLNSYPDPSVEFVTKPPVQHLSQYPPYPVYQMCNHDSSAPNEHPPQVQENEIPALVQVPQRNFSDQAPEFRHPAQVHVRYSCYVSPVEIGCLIPETNKEKEFADKPRPANDHIEVHMPGNHLPTKCPETITWSHGGHPGDQGPSGNPGPIGAVGTVGTQGPLGREGLVGPLGREGLVGPETITWSHGDHPGDQGPSGNPGPIGAVGTVGTQGPLGREGLVGPQGPQGPEGRQGKDGNQGEKGLDGLQGNKGPTGERGYPGIQGPPGKPGAQGPDGKMGLLSAH